MFMIKKAAIAVVATAVAAGFSVPFAAAQSTSARPAYGCFKVTKSLDLRETSTKSAIVVGAAAKGEILVKARRFCTAGGSYCYVTTEKGASGYAEKSKISVAPCPARLSTKVN
jgi:hypothetical protein